MKLSICVVCVALAASLFAGSSLQAQTIEQQLVVTQNQGTLNGNFQVGVQVKGTSLTGASTLGSATIDISYEPAKLHYVNATWGVIQLGDGYGTRSATDQTTFIRVGILGTAVDSLGGVNGHDVSSSYETWVTLNFTILTPSASASLTVDPSTNAIGLFQNHKNSGGPSGPGYAVINNKTLTSPINIGNVALPIQLSHFVATVVAPGQAVIGWTTLSETNNYGFEIQKAADKSVGFQTISGSFIAGNGTTTAKHDYLYIDRAYVSGNVYRLKQTDLTGSSHFTDAIDPLGVTGVVPAALPTTYTLSQNYPNPFNPSTVIEFALPKDTHVKLEVYNIIGQKVMTLVDEVRQAGYHSVKLDGTGLASGMYLYRLTTGQQSFMKKLVLMK